jgi:hypothetical protein
MLPALSAALILVGIVMAVSSAGVQGNKAGFATLLTLGIAVLIAGIVLVLIPAAAVSTAAVGVTLPVKHAPRRKPKSCMKKPKTVYMESGRSDSENSGNGGSGYAADDSASTVRGGYSGNSVRGTALAAANRPASPGVTWSDAGSSNTLENVVEFAAQDAPSVIGAAVPQTQPAHDPKAVPMRLQRGAALASISSPAPMSVTYASPSAPMPVYTATPASESSVVIPIVAGYMPASAPGGDLAAVFNPAPLPPSVGGAVYYHPPYPYPTVGEIAEERNRFWAKPETPDIDRHRRLGQLRDYALTMRPQRSGLMVPVAAV